MRILIVTPAPNGSRTGNRVTALRWARMLKELGHRVHIDCDFKTQQCDLLIALHARKSAASIKRFSEVHPDSPLVVALTGTDLYGDLPKSKSAIESVELADRLIVLQSEGINSLPKKHREKTRVIFQSTSLWKFPKKLSSVFEICVVGHLRSVKDPFRAEIASRKLPRESRICITHIGGSLEPSMEKRALQATKNNPRYRWLGELSPGKTRQLLARSRVTVLSSKMEGGAHVISEACVAGVPVLSSYIPGSVGMLGAEYPGYFPEGDTEQLRTLMLQTERDVEFLNQLVNHCRQRASLFQPAKEKAALKKLLREY